MAIIFDEQSREFMLSTDHTSYVIKITDDGYAAHLYYGKKLNHFLQDAGLREGEFPAPGKLLREKGTYLSSLPFEYPTEGVGDSRPGALSVRNEKGQYGCELFYKEHSIEQGKPGIPGLPASFAGGEDIQTLRLVLTDPVLALTVTLFYSVFPKEDIITRSAAIANDSAKTYSIARALSASFDMDDRNFEMLTLDGAWARERHICRRPIGYGVTAARSVRGESGHQENPFFALLEPGNDQEKGDVYGLLLMYSGNHLEMAEKSQNNMIRASLGINPNFFSWKLGSGETFYTPEAVLTYSDSGLTAMTHSYHDFIRGHIIRSPWKEKLRPILINNWEATYFNFDADKIVSIAKDAKDCGIEMMVMDDGWFGKRDSDNCALGDWFVNEEKIGKLSDLVNRVKALGMKFGIWFEPEMISPDSDLYRAHPDWALQISGRTPTLLRNQLVLDLSRKEIRDEIYSRIANVLKSAPIDYVKWDMNRNLSDIGSAAADAEGQGELFHRYVLGVYEMQERLITDFPDLLLENCSGGGGRFDAGMLYYSPQIWCSDDTDAIERLRIQEGTGLVYPLSTMGAHVSKCPNEQVGRNTPFETRANVALAGTFGYELNIANLPEKDRALIPEQVRRYHEFHMLIADGDYYRLHSWNDEEPYDCWMNTEKDGSCALITYVQVLGRPSTCSRKVYLRGLVPDAEYEIQEVNPSRVDMGYGRFTAQKRGYGDELMNAGFLVPSLGDYESRLYSVKRVRENS